MSEGPVKQGLSHQNIRKICSIAILLAMLFAALPLAVKAQQRAYPPGDWTFQIGDNWALWGADAAKYDPTATDFSAVAYLYNTTGKETFTEWLLIGKGETNEKGIITIRGLPGNAWNTTFTGQSITYALLIKLKIRGVETPITIFNATVLTITGTLSSDESQTASALYDLLHKTITNGGVYPGADWITGIAPYKVVEGRAFFRTWLYYIAMQPMDEKGFPVTGATLTVFFDSDYNGYTYMNNTRVSSSDWLNKLYGKWTVNGSLGSELIPDTEIDADETIYDPYYRVGWVILRVPLINSTTATGTTWRSSLVSGMNFWWNYKTNTTIAAMRFTKLGAPAISAPWGNLAPEGYSTYVVEPLVNDPLPNSTHWVNVNIRWTGIRLLDCQSNNWWTMKAEVYMFDESYKNLYGLKATRVGPGTYLLRYPVPTGLYTRLYFQGFETWPPANWAVWGAPSCFQGAWSQSDEQVYAGSYSAKLTYDTAAGDDSGRIRWRPAGAWTVGWKNLKGQTITYYLYIIYTPPAPDQYFTANVFLRKSDGSTVFHIGGPDTPVPPDQWVKVSYTFTTEPDPNGYIDIGIEVYHPSGFSGTATVYLDSFEIATSPVVSSDFTIGVEWYYSTVNITRLTISTDDDPLEGSLTSPVTLKCNMTWVDVNFWSSAELPQQPSEFAAKIWLPSTMAYREEAPLTFWWNGVNGFAILPDMEYYVGPNPSTLDKLDPYGVAMGDGFEDFWKAMSQSSGTAGGFGGQGWLPTREVGWVDFQVWYEGVLVLDTYESKESLKIPCCVSYPPGANPNYPNGYTECRYSFKMNIFEVGWHIVLEACGKKMDNLTGIPFFFKHPNPDIGFGGMVGPKATTSGKVDIVKAPKGEYSNFVIVWQLSVLRPYKIEYMFENGTVKEISEPIYVDRNMRNIVLYFRLWNLTVEPLSQDPFRIVNVYVTLFSESDFGLAPGIGISKRQLDQITYEHSIYRKYVLPPGWTVYKEDVDEYGFPKLYYKTDTKKVTSTALPGWAFLPEKDYYILVKVPEDSNEAVAAGFRAVDANATLYWSGDPGAKPVTLNRCYGSSSPYRVNTYVYDPRIVLKTACGEPLVFTEEDSSALILAEPWSNGAGLILSKQQTNPSLPTYNAYLVRKNATDSKGVIKISSVNASATGKDPDIWNPATGSGATYYPQQSRYLIGSSPGSGPVKGTSPKYRFMVYYKGVLVFNESIPLSNPYVSKENVLVTSVYPYVFMPVNTPFEGEQPRFGIPGVKVKVFWAGLNTSWWPTKQLVSETAPIEFSLLNASKLEKGFNMSVVKRLWGPKPEIAVPIESVPFTPVAPYLSSLVWEEEGVTNAEGKVTFLIPVWNYSVTPNIYTWVNKTDSEYDPVNLVEYEKGPRNPWNVALGPLSINLRKAGDAGRMPYIFGTPVYAEFWTIPGTTVNIPANDVPRLLSPIEDNKYCMWIQYAMNATGLVNPATKVWKDTKCVSLNTTYRADYRSTTCMGVAVGGVGMLSGGAYQGRTPDRETGTTVTQGQDGCYAKVEERVPANDLRVVVRNIEKIGLPNQRVTVIRENVYKYVKDGKEYASWVDGGSKELVEAAKVWLVEWTPTVPNAPSPDYYKLELRSTPSMVFWGIYNVTVKTENLTSKMDNVKLRLNDPQFLVKRLLGTDIDWSSQTVYLDWPARLKITILTEDGRPLDKAWVYIIDAYSRGNVTAAITDDYGHAGTLYVGKENAAPALIIEPGDRVDIGFNLLRGWYWLNESRMLSGEPVNPDWDIGEDPEQPIGMAYVQELEPGKWARFYGKYYVLVYYKPGGCDAVLGPVWSEVVFDSYNDEAHHQFIYLGIKPEAVAAVSDYSASQAPKYRAYVRDLKISFRDSVGRELTGVEVVAKRPEYMWTIDLGKVETGTAVLSKVPLRAGTSYVIDARWTSRYGGKQAEVKNYPVKELESVVVMPVYDVTLRIVTKKGTPLVGVDVKVEGEPVGATAGLTGEVLVTQIPAGTYSVSARWLDTDLTLPSLKVTASGIATLTPTNTYTLTVRVLGAQGQAIEGATVRVTKGAIELTRLTDKDGKAEIELPGASYNLEVTYGNFRATESVTLTTDTVKTVNLDVFIELFGVGMTMAQFLLLIVMVIIIVIVLAVVVHEYHIYRRKRLPQLFGAPAAPK